MEYLSEDRVEIIYDIPLGEIVMDFFDALKSRTRGYASLDYEAIGNRESALVKVDVLLNNTPVDAFSSIVHKDRAFEDGRRMTARVWCPNLRQFAGARPVNRRKFVRCRAERRCGRSRAGDRGRGGT